MVAGLSLAALGAVAAEANGVLAGRGPQPGVRLYPANVANPRLPTFPLDQGGAAGGLCVGVECGPFEYRLSPFVRFDQGGVADFQLRDILRRTGKKVLALSDEKQALAVQIGPASEGRHLLLVLLAGEKLLAKADTGAPLPAGWTALSLKWDASQATIESAGKTLAALRLPVPLKPAKLSVLPYHVDELALAGEGRLHLGWENGLAAAVEPVATAVATLELHGFDAMVVSQNRSQRDCPAIRFSNAAAQERRAELHFSLASEVRNHSAEWTQTLTVPTRSSVEVPLAFPFELDTDVYHLRATATGATLGENDQLRHFLYVTRRSETPGPPKFGFHSFGVSTLGSWPDALPVHWRHQYLAWGYVVGPMWVKDWNGNAGLDPDTPPEQWWWDDRIDLAIKEGRLTYVCINSTPWFPWMREKDYEPAYMNRKEWWGIAGGRPNMERYRQFVSECAKRYRGRIAAYELDNENNTISNSGKPATECADVAQVAGAAIHAIDPEAKVFGVSGTAQFVDYLKTFLQAGGGARIDGISWHTYTAPMLPYEAGLPKLLKDANEAIAATGRPLATVNSETGTFVAPREEADQPMSLARRAELIKAGVEPLAQPSGWTGSPLDEWTTARSVVQNITINFSAGARLFTFFGWDPKVGKGKTWWGESGEKCWNIFARVKDGTMTPSLYTLACGVAMVQYEGVRVPGRNTIIDQDGIYGGLFEKADGGQLAVLWSVGGRRTVLLKTATPDLEIVSLFGKSSSSRAEGGSGAFRHRVELDPDPVYLHLRQPGLELSPSPVLGLARSFSGTNESQVQFTLVNREARPWAGAIQFASKDGIVFTPQKLEFALAPGARQTISTRCAPPPGLPRGVHPAEAAMQLPDGSPFVFPLEIDVRPNFVVPRLPEDFSLASVAAWKPEAEPLLLNLPQQVVLGRSPNMTSLQEERYWKGPDELSGRVFTGYNAKGLFLRLEVRDKNQSPVEKWPGVGGSCIELFLDLRSLAGGLGSARYDRDVAQILIKPALLAGETTAIWVPPFNSDPKFEAIATAGGPLGDKSYWLGVFVPWSLANAKGTPPEAIGLDVGIDGPPAAGPGRKSQIMLFGTGANNRDAAGFGLGRLP